jgi:putative ABC transport system permease protein
MRTPLAWLNTTSSIPKLALGASGIGFAVLLMFMQIGFLNGLFDSAVQVVRLLDADLVLLSPARYTVPSEQRFDVKILDRIQPNPRVQSVHPVYIDRAVSEIRVMGYGARSIRAIGVPTDAPIFIDPAMNAKCAQLAQPNQILVDRKSKKKYGFEKKDLQRLRQQEVELSGKQARMTDWVEVGTDFVYDGTIVLSERGVAHFFPTRNGFASPLSAADLGLVILKDRTPASLEAARKEFEPLVGQGVQIMTKHELIAREIGFWARNTPIGAIFSIGTVMGLVVGVIICYQILFTDISDHLAEFATLKAMGYGPSYFLRFILAQAFYLSLFGFFPGWIASWFLYYGLAEWTGLVMRLTTGRILLVFCLTFAMCTASGLLAVRKLWAADPASLFR